MADQELQVTGKHALPAETGELTREGVYFAPAVDIYATEKELVLLADMPGVNAEHVEIDLNEDTLTILGRVPSESARGQTLLSEYKTGNYFRTFRITEIVDRSKITASISDGVLRLILPKVEKAVPRKIPIVSQ
ncbi:MAG TPA: Hsp20/alpha crystallin family protein [Desulfomonilaceae bacterium]|nr:Hsp20/alpha crystallin family protein [Desulfomonilaceae bacterium]